MSNINNALVEHSVKCVAFGFVAGLYVCVITKIISDKYRRRQLQRQAQKQQEQNQPQQEEN